MNAPERRGTWGAGLILLIACLALFTQCHLDQAVNLEEKYVTVRLHDSLSRYDSVIIQILASGDTNQVVGSIWNGRLSDPGAVPAFRLDDTESRVLSIRVRGFDENGRLTLDMMISKADGKQVVANVPLPKPSPSLASLTVRPGAMTPLFHPDVKEYAVALTHVQSDMRLTMTPKYENASMYAGSEKVLAGEGSESIDMRIGENRIIIKVTAGDTSTQYSIVATRAPAGVVEPDTTTKTKPGPR